jgi:Transcriptional regulator/sugar kinase
MAASYYVCLDIGGTKILGAIFDSKKNIVYRIKKKTKADGDATQNVEQTIISVVDELIEGFGIKPSQIKAIAAGAPGVIDQQNGIVLTSPNLPWKNYDIRKPIEKRFGAPFFIGNELMSVFWVSISMVLPRARRMSSACS